MRAFHHFSFASSFLKLILVICALEGALFAQNLSEWGPWWQQPVAREYGGEARNPNLPLPADQQLQQSNAELQLEQIPQEEVLQQRRVDESLQQKRTTNRLQQRITDELIEQGNVDEVLQQRQIDELIQQPRYNDLWQENQGGLSAP